MTIVRHIIINEVERTVEALPQSRLIDVIRENLKFTGTKEGCGEGECGACSVLINDEVVNSCLILFGQINDGDKILTVEGLGDEKHPTPLQECFIHEGGTQCGVCTPGMLIAAYAILKKNPRPTREEIAIGLAGNLCRCTGYRKIIDAVEKASKMKHGEVK